MVKAGIPERWEAYDPVGEPIEGTRLIAFKVPLNKQLNNGLSPKERWTIDDLVKRFPNIGLVIDLTMTTRYYNYEQFLTRGVDYCKIACRGHVLPSERLVSRFFAAIDTYIDSHPGGELIGVHCTHGVNRTGYMVARYLIQRMGFDFDKAISCISKARGHEIERPNYLAGLKKHLNRVPKVLDDSDIVHASEPPALPASKTGNDNQPTNSGSFRGRGAGRSRGRPLNRRGGPGHQWPKREGGFGPPRNDRYAPFPRNNFVPPFDGPPRGNPQRYGGDQGHPGPWPQGPPVGPFRNHPMQGHGFQGNPVGQDPPPPKFIKDILEVTQKLLPALGSLPQLASQLGSFKGAQRTFGPDPGPSKWGADERNDSSRPILNEQRGRLEDRRSPYRDSGPALSTWRRSPSPRRIERGPRSVSPRGRHADRMVSPDRRRFSPERRNLSRSPFRRSPPPFGFQARSGSPPYQRRSRSLERRISTDRYRQSSIGKRSTSPRRISPDYQRDRYSPGPSRRATSPSNPFKKSQAWSDYKDRPTSPTPRRSRSPLIRGNSPRSFGSPPRHRGSPSRNASRSPPRRADWRYSRDDVNDHGRDEYSRNRPNDPNPFDSRPGLKAGQNPFNARSMPKSDYNPFHSKPSRDADSNPFALGSGRESDSSKFDSRPTRKSDNSNPFKPSTSLRESPGRMRLSSPHRDNDYNDEDRYANQKHGNRSSSPLFSRKTPVGQRLSPGPDCRELILQKRLYSSPSSREGSPFKEGLLPPRTTGDIFDSPYEGPSYDRSSPDRFRLPAIQRLGIQSQNPFDRSAPNPNKKPVFNRLEGKQSNTRTNYSPGGDFQEKRGRSGDQGGDQRGGQHGGQRDGQYGGQRDGQYGGQRGGQYGGQRGGQYGGQRGGQQGGQRGAQRGVQRGGQRGVQRGGQRGVQRGGQRGVMRGRV